MPATTDIPTTIPELRIIHNHGEDVLRDVTVEASERKDHDGRVVIWRTVTGTVVSGGVTNRLFQYTSFTPLPVGEVKTYTLYAREIRPRFVSGTGYSTTQYVVDTCSFG